MTASGQRGDADPALLHGDHLERRGPFPVPADPLVPAEHLRNIEAANAASPLTDAPATLLDEFDRTVAAFPDHEAIVAGANRLTFGQVHGLSTTLARTIDNLLTDQGPNVVLAARKPHETIIAILALLRCAAPLALLPPNYPVAAMDRLLEQQAMQAVLVATDGVQVTGRLSDWPVMEVDLNELQSEQSVGEQYDRVGSDPAVFSIATDETTGELNVHLHDPRAIALSIASVVEAAGISSSDRVMASDRNASPEWLFSACGVLGQGAALILPDEATHDNNRALARLLADQRVTIALANADILGDILLAAESSAITLPVRTYLLNGAPIPASIVSQLRAHEPSCRIIALDPQPQVAIWAHMHVVEGDDLQADIVPLGKPLGAQRSFVVNAKLDLCPVWVEGSLCLAGEALAEVVFPAATQSPSQVRHPRTGERMHVCTRRARYLPDGEIDLVQDMARSSEPAPPRRRLAGEETADAELLEQVLEAARRILDLDDLSAEDELLALGVDSVGIIRLANVLTKDFGFREEIEFLFENPIMAEIANACRPARDSARSTSISVGPTAIDRPKE